MSASTFFSEGWAILRVAVVGSLTYAVLILFLRISGKRTLSKMNAFDLVVTVALGSTLATVLLSKDVSLAEGVAALALLIGLQFGVAWTALRFPALARAVKSEPRLLLFRGQAIAEAMRDERVSEAELRAAVRARGLNSLEDAEAVVLETAGDLSVIPRTSEGAPPLLQDVRQSFDGGRSEGS